MMQERRERGQNVSENRECDSNEENARWGGRDKRRTDCHKLGARSDQWRKAPTDQ